MEKKRCYALFIGINTYENEKVANLSGCIQDAQRLLNYIEANLNQEKYELKVKTLFTGSENSPTRQNIIENIQTHLGQATKEDMILLFYAGHGSKEKAPVQFKEADGNFQTLVPCDARNSTATGGTIRNILDKELRFLLHQLWEKERPEIVFIQDSCHSTGASRASEQLTVVLEELKALEQELQEEEAQEISAANPQPRFAEPTDVEKRGDLWSTSTVDELLENYTGLKNAPEWMTAALAASEGAEASFELPMAEHIHLAACDKHQFAYEIPLKGGVFTSNLLDILEASQNTISYQDLFNRIRMNIGGVYQQTPDLYVHSPNYQKRHEIFLGDLLIHKKIPAQRDIDVFNGFYPVVPKGRTGWQIKAGELELLPSLEGQIQAIPIEVFLQDQQLTGNANAVIDYVASGYSQVTFTSAVFDRRKHRNQLYAKIPPKYMRRWRVSICVDAGQTGGNTIALFEDYAPRKSLKNFQSDGGPAVRIAANVARADFVVKVADNCLALYQKDGTFVFYATALQYEEEGQQRTISVIKKGTEEPFCKYKKGKEMPLDWEGTYTITSAQKASVAPVFDYLAIQYQKNPQQNIQVFFEETVGENAFTKFQKTQQKVLNYYAPFINWTSPEKAKYILKTASDGFVVYPYNNGETGAVPAFRKTLGLSTKDGYRVIIALQKMCKWQTVFHLYNKLQKITLAQHQFEFEFKLYQAVATKSRGLEPNRSHSLVKLQSWNAAQFLNEERGLSQALNQLQATQTPIRFLYNELYPSTLLLDFDLAIHHLKGNANVYISTLLLDSNYAILPLQKTMGSNLLPPKTLSTSGGGTLFLNGLELHQPQQMKNFPEEIKEVTFFLKIFIAYQRFDVSGLLQTGLPAPAPKLARHMTAKDGTRAMLKKRPKTEDTGSWMSFTIPIVVEREIRG
jgi:hypothetical protein